MTELRHIADVATIISGVGFPKGIQGRSEGDVPVFKVGDISAAWKRGDRFLRKSPNNIGEAEARILGRRVPAGSTVFAKIGEGLRLNRRAMLSGPALVDNNVMALVPRLEDVIAEYLFYFSQTIDLGRLSRATAVPSVRKSDVSELLIPIPSIDEQRRIVVEIETQFSRLDDAVANLHRVNANLKRYKAAVLKAAVEGRLVPTEAELARRDGRTYEAGVEILDRARTVCEEQMKRNATAIDPTNPDGTALPPVPKSWSWTTSGALLTSIEAGASFKCLERPPTSDEVGVLKVSAVTWGEYDEAQSKTCTDPRRLVNAYLVEEGDFLFSRANTIELVGSCVIVKRVTKKLMLSDKTLRFRLVDRVMPDWLLVCLRSRFGRHEIERLATGNQDSMRNIGQERIRQIRLPLPPLAEQRRIVAEVDRHLTLARHLATDIARRLILSSRLKAALLANAFPKC